MVFGKSAPRKDLPTAVNMLLASAMIACLAFTFSRLMGAFAPAHSFVHVTPLAFLAALEAQATMRFLDRGSSLSRRWLHLAALEAGGILAAVKLTDWAIAGPTAAWAELERWPLDFPGAFFSGTFFFVLLTVAAAWIVSRILAADLIELERMQPMRGREAVRDPFEDLYKAQRSLSEMVMALGGAAVVLGVMAMHVVPFFTDRADLGPALGMEVLAFFLFGFTLLSFSYFSVQRAGWAFDRIPVGPEMSGRWVRYSLLFLVFVTLLSVLLPADYASGFLQALYEVAFTVWTVVAFVISLILLPISMALAWLYSLFGTTPVPPASAEEQPLPKLTPASTPDYIRAVFFWIVVAALCAYVLQQLWVNRGEIAKRLRGARRPAWMSRITDWLARRYGKARAALARRLEDGLAGLRRRIRGGVTLPAIALSLRGRTPRQQVLAIYLALVRRGGEVGLARRPSQTPEEYAALLRNRVPDGARESDSLTDAFVDARYARRTIEPERAGAARSAWERLKRYLVHGLWNGEQ